MLDRPWKSGITHEDIDGWLATIERQGVSQSDRNYAVGQALGCFPWCYRSRIAKYFNDNSSFRLRYSLWVDYLRWADLRECLPRVRWWLGELRAAFDWVRHAPIEELKKSDNEDKVSAYHEWMRFAYLAAAWGDNSGFDDYLNEVWMRGRSKDDLLGCQAMGLRCVGDPRCLAIAFRLLDNSAPSRKPWDDCEGWSMALVTLTSEEGDYWLNFNGSEDRQPAPSVEFWRNWREQNGAYLEWVPEKPGTEGMHWRGGWWRVNQEAKRQGRRLISLDVK